MIRFSLEQDPSGGLDDVVKEYVAIFQSLGHEIEVDYFGSDIAFSHEVGCKWKQLEQVPFF